MQNPTVENTSTSTDMFEKYMSKHDKREGAEEVNAFSENGFERNASYSRSSEMNEAGAELRVKGKESIKPILEDNVWESDQADFVPTRQTMSFDANTGALFANIPGNGAIPIDSYEARISQKKKETPPRKRRYLFLVRECKDKFIVTSYLTNIRIESIEDFRETHRNIIKDFVPYIYDYSDSVSAEKYLEQYLSELSKTFRSATYEDTVLVVNIKEKAGEKPMFRKIPPQFEVEVKE